MEENILKSWKIFQLKDLEKSVKAIEMNIPEEITQRENLCLLGFVVLDKSVNKEAFTSLMQMLWHLKGRVEFKEVCFNLFIIEFRETLDITRIQEGRPWMFDQNLLYLTKYNKHLTSQHVSFTKELMWVQLHDLSFGLMNRNFSTKLGKLMGEVTDIDVDQDGLGCGLYLRV